MFRFLILLLIPFTVFAGGNGSQQLFGDWNTVFINGKFSKDSNWVYYSEFSERNSQGNGGNGFNFAQFTTYDGIGYRFNDNHTLLAGFWYQYTQPPYSGKIVQEANAWEQYNYTRMTQYGKLTTRSRLEQRNNLTAPDTSVRYRQQVKFVYPFNDKWSAVGSEEIFFNLNSVNWGPTSGFDQNRVFVGAGYNFDKTFRTEFGYMNQYVNRNLKADFIDHQLSLNLYINVPD
jgi:Protein of unknown function (DUF2490)